MSEGGSVGGGHFIKLAIAIVIALIISPLIFQGISSANSSGKITGTLATIVNLVPLFYYLAVAVLAIVDVYARLRIFKQTVSLVGRKIVSVTIWVSATFIRVVIVFYQGLRPIGA